MRTLAKNVAEIPPCYDGPVISQGLQTIDGPIQLSNGTHVSGRNHLEDLQSGGKMI